MTSMPEVEMSYVVALNPSLSGPLILGPLALGLLIYIYAFCSEAQKGRAFGKSLLLAIEQRESQLQGIQNTHICLFTLLIFDAFTLIMGITLGVLTLLPLCAEQELFCTILINMWLAFRWLSLSQYLITALISILFVYHPSWASGLRIIGKLLYLPPFIFVIVAFRTTQSVLIGRDIFNLLVMLAIVVSCLLNTSSTIANQRKLFLLLAAFTYICVCLPNSVLNCMVLLSQEYVALSVDVLYITNYYFIMDALLFYFVLKINEEQHEYEYEGAIRCA